MADKRRHWFSSTHIAVGLLFGVAGWLLGRLTTERSPPAAECMEVHQAQHPVRDEPRVDAAKLSSSPEEDRTAVLAEGTKPTAPSVPPASEPKPKTEHEFRIANMKEWLADVQANKAGLRSEQVSCLLAASIAEIMDAQGRGIPREVGKRTAFPGPGSNQRVFVYNGTTYIFPTWEFPEYDAYHSLTGRTDDAKNPITTEEAGQVIADIVSRAKSALSLQR